MAKMKPWYQLVTPREDLRQNRPMDASEFAVHLDHIRNGTANVDYTDPARFFERTFMTRSLMDMASQVVRRLSGNKVETSAVFNMATQFGGGKTHSLTALYHLAKGGEAAGVWQGVSGILTKAEVAKNPKANVAVFVGTEFDTLDGRGGKGNEPLRRTPWGEIAWQLGGNESFATVAKHDEEGVAPAGDVIRKMLPKGPSLILVDELLTYISRTRKTGMASQTYNFIHSLSEEARAQDKVALCVSIPASELEMNPEDQRDYDSFKKLLDRVGKAVSMSSDTEVSEIIRRRLFEWHGFSKEMNETVAEYAAWARQHASEVSLVTDDSVEEIFRNSYPFHPCVLSVFERKWQSLPRFQRTRGILRLLALWISWAYQEEHRKAANEPLISLGGAPLEYQTFRDAAFEQLGSTGLQVPVLADISGKSDSHAVRLDKEANEQIRKSRLHQKVATVIFMESNGGQSQSKAEASLPEIRSAVGAPGVNLADVAHVLDGLTSTSYYLNWDRNRYRYGLRPNLNQILVTRRGAVTQRTIDERVAAVTQTIFNAGSRLIERRFFPTRSNDIPDRPQLVLAVMGTEFQQGLPTTKAAMENFVRDCGSSGRTCKSGLIFAVQDGQNGVKEAAQNLLAWEDIENDEDTKAQLEDAQRRNLQENVGRAKRDLNEAVYRSYKYIYLLEKGNGLKEVNLGTINSSMANSLPELIINELKRNDEITDSVGPTRLLRYWPPAIREWTTKALRDAFYASPALPRLIHGDSIKRTIADAVSQNLVGYARKDGERIVLERFESPMNELEVEISDDWFLLKAEDARKFLDPPRLVSLRINPESVQVHPGDEATFRVTGEDQYGHNIEPQGLKWTVTGGTVLSDGKIKVGDTPGVFQVAVRAGDVESMAQIRVETRPVRPPQTEASGDNGGQTTVTKGLQAEKTVIKWAGNVPKQKWTNFYTKVVSPISNNPGLSLKVELTITEGPESALTQAQIERIRSGLRELGLEEDLKS